VKLSQEYGGVGGVRIKENDEGSEISYDIL
jgi:hypothetical protein